MLLYSIIIILGMASIIILNIFLNPMNEPFWFYIVYTIGMTLLVILIDGLVALIIRKLPERWFSYKRRCYNASDRKMRFFKAIGVHKWKNYIPELGGFTSFHKDKLTDPYNDEYIKRYILEACYGYSIHIYSVPFSFLILLADYKMYYTTSNLWLTICLPVALVNAILILLPAFILKFNLRKLIHIHELNLAKANRQKEKGI